MTGSWRHLFPTPKRIPNLDQIARSLLPFDIVGLQEVDGGGSRSRHVVQTQYLAEHAGFPHWHNQINRRIGRIALHSNGLLSRFRPLQIMDLKLPGLPGRGAILARFGGSGDAALHICVLHLALSRRARLKQLAFVAERLNGLAHVVLMGDLNCEPRSPELQFLAGATSLCDPVEDIKTFPSWRPKRMLDHILVTPSLEVKSLQALHCDCSDHLPLAMNITLPDAVRLFPFSHEH